MPLIKGEFESYRRALLIDAPPDQIKECKRAFYAGAIAALAMNTIANPGVLLAELKSFRDNVEDGLE